MIIFIVTTAKTTKEYGSCCKYYTLLHKDFRTRMWFSEHVTENKQPNEKLKAKSVDMTSCLLTLQNPKKPKKKL